MDTALLQKRRSHKPQSGQAEKAHGDHSRPDRSGGESAGMPLFLQRQAETSLAEDEQQGMGEEEEEEVIPQVQAKLVVGARDDPYEQEADDAAQAVVQRSAAPDITPLDEEEDEEPVQRFCEGCESELAEDEEGPIRRMPASSAPMAGSKGSALNIPDAGAAIPEGVREEVEPVVGADLSHVRVHTSPSAQATAKDLHAKAFTHQHHIWLGPGQSADDLELMAHESAHVVQQSSGDFGVQAIQRRPADYQHPEDGGAIESRLNQRFREEIGDRDPLPPGEAIDRGAVRSRSAGLRRSTRPAVDRAAQERPKVERSAMVVEEEAESPPEPLVEGEQSAQPEAAGEGNGGEAIGAAEQAAGLARQSFAAAAAQPEPPAPVEVRPPNVVAPVDASGEPLDPDPEADAALGDIAGRIQMFRQRGALLRGQAADGHANAEIIRGNIALVSGEVTKAEEGITTAQGHAEYRQDTLEQADQALEVSEEKQATVAAGTPEYQSKADEGREDSGPMASEASSIASENASNVPDDPEAAQNAREQGGQINRVSSGASTMDDAITGTRSRADSLVSDAEHAAQVNTATRDTLTTGRQELEQTEQRLGQHEAEAGQARAQVEGLAGAPDQAHAQADQLAAQAEAIDASSMELESRMHAAQQTYIADTHAIPEVQPWEGETPEEGEAETGGTEIESAAAEESTADFGLLEEAGTAPEEVPIQMLPEDDEPASSASEATSTAATATAETAEAETLPSDTSRPTTTSAEPTATGGPTGEGGTSPAAEAPAALPSPTSETAAAEEESTGESPESAEGETAGEGGEPEAGGAGPEEGAIGPAEDAATSMQPEVVLGPRQEEAHLESELPPWLTGVNPESARGREEAQRQADERRRQEVTWINEQLGNRSVAQMGVGERFSMVGRVLNRRFQGAISNIRWPGWSGLGQMALGMLDPRSHLAGAVGGLDMIVSGVGNLFSADQWLRDPLGNLLTSAANIATGIAVILGSITALAGLVIAVLGALILLSFGAFAAPFAPIIAFCTTVITTVGGWAIAAGKIALVLQALALIKNLVDVATAQTADDLQRETDEISGNVSGGFQAVMSITGAKGAQAGISRLGSRITRTTAARTAAGGSRALARQTARGAPAAIRGAARRAGEAVRAAPGAITSAGRRAGRTVRAAPGRLAQGARRRWGALGDRLQGTRTAISDRLRRTREGLRDRSRRGRPGPELAGRHRETLRGTRNKSGGELTQRELDAEMDVVRNTQPRPIARGDYDAEVRLPPPHRHRWRRNRENGAWCRFSDGPDVCTLPETPNLTEQVFVNSLEQRIYWNVRDRLALILMRIAMLNLLRRNPSEGVDLIEEALAQGIRARPGLQGQGTVGTEDIGDISAS